MSACPALAGRSEDLVGSCGWHVGPSVRGRRGGCTVGFVGLGLGFRGCEVSRLFGVCRASGGLTWYSRVLDFAVSRLL